MATIKVPYLATRPGAQGGKRHFWVPGPHLRLAGWRPERLPDDFQAAVLRANDINKAVKAWRKGAPLNQDATETAAAPIAVPTVLPPAARPIPTTPVIVADLIRKYRASPFFLGKAPKTKRGYNQNLQVIEAWAGGTPVRVLTGPRIAAFYELLYAKTPSKANAVIGMLRILLGYGVKVGSVAVNVAASPGMISQPFNGRLWPRDAKDLLIEAADKLGWHSVGTAIEMNWWLGQREGDVLAWPRAQYRNGRFYVKQRKTGKRVGVRDNPQVAARVAAELEAQRLRGILGTPSMPLLLCETTGQAWTEDHFRKVFQKVRAAADEKWPGFEQEDGSMLSTLDLQFMHLRHTAVTEHAIAGSTVPQISGITGHSLKTVEAILEHYLIRTEELADAGTDKRMARDAAEGEE
ncbi:MAG TPA: hypothetical protein VNT30_09215 [Stellaceae bacterium]|nr:hypothetical protein [Stellaceae bacterium]